MRDQQKILSARQEIEKYFNLNLEAKSRKRSAVIARQFYYYWMRSNTFLSFKGIANTLQYLKQDHSTVIHAINDFKDKSIIEKEYRLQWKEVLENIDKATGNIIDEENLVLNAS